MTQTSTDQNPELWVDNDYPHLRAPRTAVLLDKHGEAIASADVGTDGKATFYVRGPVVTGAWVARTPKGDDVMHVPGIQRFTSDGTFTIDTNMKET